MSETNTELKQKCLEYAIKINESKKSSFEESLTETAKKIIKVSEKFKEYLVSDE